MLRSLIKRLRRFAASEDLVQLVRQNSPQLPGPERYVFLITYARSGSTLLQHVLNGIPGYCIRGENHNVLTFLAAGWRAAETTANSAPQDEIYGADHPWFGVEKVAPGLLGRQLAESFITNVLAPPAGTRVSGCKEIRWHHEAQLFLPTLAFLQQQFPDCRFIFNQRDHSAVVRSLTRSRWWKSGTPEGMYPLLQRGDALFSEGLAQYPDRSLLLRYEDYADNPNALRPLFDFLGEPFDLDRVSQQMAQRLEH